MSTLPIQPAGRFLDEPREPGESASPLDLLRGAVRAVQVDTTASVSWFGVPVVPPLRRNGRAPAVRPGTLRSSLRARLYRSFFCSGRARPTGLEWRSTPAAAADFAAGLLAADPGGAYWDAGWEVSAPSKDGIRVHQEGLELSAERRQIRPGGPEIAPGIAVDVRLPCALPRLSQGYHVSTSHQGPPRAGDVLRLYLNVRPAGAARLVQVVVRALNRAELPFRLKVRNDPAGFDRCDTAVLYVRREDHPAVFEVLRTHILPALAADLRPSVPALTRRFAPGLALAESPRGGESFGLHRCGLIAEALIRSHRAGRSSVEERLLATVERFTDAGLRVNEPFLNPGSTNRYSFEPDRSGFVPRRRQISPPPASPFDRGAPLDVAHGIARHLARSAIWHRNRCTWLASDGPLAQSGERPSITALGADLYGGCSGVALFLAEAYAATGEPGLRRTALGAIRQVARTLDEGGLPRGRGLYDGSVGMALAAARVGSVVSDDESLLRAHEWAAALRSREPWDRPWDLVSGSAGIVVGLLTLGQILQLKKPREQALEEGELLLDKARAMRAGVWRGSRRGDPVLTGLAHGAAGVAVALLELHRLTGAPAFRSAAEHVLACESRWFLPAAGNWADLRDVRGPGLRDGPPLPVQTAWCHGAPGIALSRVRACEILGNEGCRAEAEIALETTRRNVAEALATREPNFSLCHGLAGNAEALLEGARVLGAALDGEPARRVVLALDNAVEAVARAGVERYVAPCRAWPCGTVDGRETPGLMLGLAGIGRFYLRLHDPTLPSILLIRPDAFTTHQDVSARRASDAT